VDEVKQAFDPVSGIQIVMPQFEGNFQPVLDTTPKVPMSAAILKFLGLHVQVIDANGTKVRRLMI